MRHILPLMAAFACSGALASEPGQPLDCSDWVFMAPGYSCTSYASASSGISHAFFDKGSNRVVDNGGALLVLDGGGPMNGQPGIDILRFDSTGQHVIAHLEPRIQDSISTLNACPHVDDGGTPNYTVSLACPNAASAVSSFELNGSIAFDAANGRLLVTLRSFCGSGTCPQDYGGGWWIAAISGFATTFEVLQSYTPQASIGFRVPYMPEGMAGADHFDTYWGTLTHSIDFTQAHPLQCGYPATASHVGDYLTVADTVPTPAPGQSVYYVTATTYQGATRYGRKTTAGHLSGRDPAILPACGP